ncbi:MAG TPA: hypothetical protein VKE40_07510 [Gemmataceae bacterium]|nr:hypothetical protein [Gemmataceae bacterium]
MPPPAAKVLRCYACGRTVACTEEEVTRYTQTGWPSCCGETMSLFAPADWSGKPTPDQESRP